jgi:quercetin dioxygenase-like cupin family protein
MYARFVILSGLVGAAASGVALAADDGFLRTLPEDVRWSAADAASLGVREAVVAGDPDKPGVYVIRVRFPPHVMDHPHYHPNARYVTVLEGVWCAGTGDRFDPRTAVRMPAGSFMYHPAKAPHWDGSCNDEPVVVQITGIGPADTIQVDPKEPMWVKVGS